MEVWLARATSPRFRQLSKAAFGQELRLALCLYIGRAGDAYFTLGSAARAMDVTASAIQAPLGSLMAMGVVRRVEVRPVMTREHWLVRESSAIWSLADELFADDDRQQMSLDIEL